MEIDNAMLQITAIFSTNSFAFGHDLLQHGPPIFGDTPLGPIPAGPPSNNWAILTTCYKNGTVKKHGLSFSRFARKKHVCTGPVQGLPYCTGFFLPLYMIRVNS